MNEVNIRCVLISLIATTLLSCYTKNEEPKAINKIAFGSCAIQWLEQPIWSEIEKKDPDLFVFLGDAIYGDWDGENVFEVTEESLDRDYNLLASKENFQSFIHNRRMMAVWDNHDYGSHNGGVEFAKKEMTKKKFLNFFKEPADSERRKREGIYDSKLIELENKKIQIILLDTRWFRSNFKLDTLNAEERKSIGKVGKYIANTDSGATILGDQQWNWLKSELNQPADLRIICSSTQVIPNQKGMDEWGVFPNEREKLLKLLDSSYGKSVILSGNVHFAELSEYNDIFELTSSGLTHINEEYGNASNKYRLGDPIIELNFGMIEIDWRQNNLSLEIFDNKGIQKMNHKIDLYE